MSASGSLGITNGQAYRLPTAHVLTAGDRKAAYYLGGVRRVTRRGVEGLASGSDPAEVLGQLLTRLGRLVDEGERTLDPAVRGVVRVQRSRGTP